MENGICEVLINPPNNDSIFSNSYQPSSIESTPINQEYHKTPQDIKEEFETGADFNYLFKEHPESTFKAIRDLSIKKLGDLELPDTVVLNVFKDNSLLTRGSDTIDDDDYAVNWKNYIDDKCKKDGRYIDTGWKDMIKISVYAIRIKNIAEIHDKGLLYSIILKAKAADLLKEIFKLPVIQALVDYKWNHILKKFVVIEYVIHLIWIVSYIIFVTFFTRLDDLFSESFDEGVGSSMESIGNRNSIYMLGLPPLTVCFVAMLPFISIEINSIIAFKSDWFNKWKLFNVIIIYNQIMLTILYLIKFGLGRGWYSILLAMHSIIMFIKLQYFHRCFTNGSAIIEVLCNVIWHVRWFLLFILFTIVSSTFLFMNLYRLEDKTKDIFINFDGFFNTFVTMFGFMIGGFKYNMILESHIPLITSGVFVLFQFYLGILLINLLIGAMTGTYIKMIENDFSLFMKNRALAISETEVSWPKSILKIKGIDNFIHFAIIKKKNFTKKYGEIEETLNECDEINDIHDKMDKLKDEIKHLTDKILKLSQEKI